MELTLFTNSNEIHNILTEHGVNVKDIHLMAQWETQDIVIFDERLIRSGGGDKIKFTLRDVETLRPAWREWLLPPIRAQVCIPEYGHQCTLFFSGLHYYDVIYDKERACYIFDKAWTPPEHFRQRDVLFTTECLRHASRQTITELLRIPRMVKDIQNSLYYDVKLGCPLSLYELQNSVVHAFKELLQNSEENMEL